MPHLNMENIYVKHFLHVVTLNAASFSARAVAIPQQLLTMDGATLNSMWMENNAGLS